MSIKKGSHHLILENKIRCDINMSNLYSVWYNGHFDVLDIFKFNISSFYSINLSINTINYLKGTTIYKI